jgi:hypothetical protein
MGIRTAIPIAIAFIVFAPDAQLKSIRDYAALDLNGTEVKPFKQPKINAVAFIFIAHDCPISNAYVPEINRIHAKYVKRGAEVYTVYIEPGRNNEIALRHAKEYSIRCRAIADPLHKLVKLAGATVTPEAAVFDGEGKLAYRGRINDLYLELGKPRFAATRHDLRAALDAVLTRKPVSIARTKAIGCFIPELQTK